MAQVSGSGRPIEQLHRVDDRQIRRCGEMRDAGDIAGGTICGCVASMWASLRRRSDPKCPQDRVEPAEPQQMCGLRRFAHREADLRQQRLCRRSPRPCCIVQAR